MVRHAFEQWGCRRVELKTDALNQKSETRSCESAPKKKVHCASTRSLTPDASVTLFISVFWIRSGRRSRQSWKRVWLAESDNIRIQAGYELNTRNDFANQILSLVKNRSVPASAAEARWIASAAEILWVARISA